MFGGAICSDLLKYDKLRHHFLTLQYFQNGPGTCSLEMGDNFRDGTLFINRKWRRFSTSALA